MEDKKREERDEARVDDERDDAEAVASKSESSKSEPQAKAPSGAAPQDDAEDDEEAGDEEDEDAEEDGEEPAAPPKMAAQPRDKPAVAKVRARAAQQPTAKPPVDPSVARNGELRVGLITSTAGYLAFWGAWMIYSKSIAARQINYFSHSAWLFMIAYALVTIAAFYFIRLEASARFPQAAGAKPSTVEPGKTKDSPYRKAAQEERLTASVPRVDKTGLLLAAAVCGPLYAVYWYVAKSVLQAQYDKMWWAIELGAFVAITVGAWWGLRPPSIEDERRERMPTRRVLTLMMVPFLLVFGMIWLASAYPPWPS